MTKEIANQYSVNNITHNSKIQNHYFKFIAYLQIIGIIFVVLAHSIHEYPDGCHGKSTLIYRMICSFDMPMFMFTSGFLMIYTSFMRTNSKSHSMYEFSIKKVKRLLIPFFTLSLVTYIPRALMSGMADDQIDISLNSFGQIFLFGNKLIIPYFWFLQSSFTLLIFNYIILRLTENRCPIMVTQLVIVVIFATLPLLSIEWSLFFSFNETIRLGVYFSLGGVYAICGNVIDKYVRWDSYTFLFIITVIWVSLFYICEDTQFIIACSIAGILMCISIAKILESRQVHILDHLMGANYIIFLLSWYFNVLSQQVLSHYVNFPWWIHSALSLTFGIYIPWLGYKYILSHPKSKFVRICAFLLGQNTK